MMESFGNTLNAKDTITVAVDMERFEIYIGVNGTLLETESTLELPENMRGRALFPMLLLQRRRVEFNFGKPRKPIKELIEKGFTTIEDIVKGQKSKEQTQVATANANSKTTVDWTSQGITDWLWLDILVSLQSPEIYRCRSVCRQWRDLISKFNIMERNEMCCFFTKRNHKSATLGIGLHIAQAESGYRAEIKTQMDILSLAAWNVTRTGVWGERMTHFLPLVMNREHSDCSYDDIRKFLGQISTQMCSYALSAPNRDRSRNELEEAIAGNEELQLVDALVTMMNAIVLQFAMDSDKFHC